MCSCEGVGQSSSSVVMGITAINVVDILLTNQISGPPSGWRSVAISAPTLRAIMEGHVGCPLR